MKTIRIIVGGRAVDVPGEVDHDSVPVTITLNARDFGDVAREVLSDAAVRATASAAQRGVAALFARLADGAEQPPRRRKSKRKARDDD